MQHQSTDCASCQCPISMVKTGVGHAKKTHYLLCILPTKRPHTDGPSPKCREVYCLAYEDISSNERITNPVIHYHQACVLMKRQDRDSLFIMLIVALLLHMLRCHQWMSSCSSGRCSCHANCLATMFCLLLLGLAGKVTGLTPLSRCYYCLCCCSSESAELFGASLLHHTIRTSALGR